MIRQDYTDNAIDPTTTGQTQLGPVNTHRFGGSVYAKLVTALVGGPGADMQFNVNLDQQAIFAATQTFSVSDQFETFVPDQNRHASGPNVGLEFDITSAASGLGISTLFTGVLLETHEEDDG